MTDQTTTGRAAEIRARYNQTADPVLGAFSHWDRDDIAVLLGRIADLEGQLAQVRENQTALARAYAAASTAEAQRAGKYHQWTKSHSAAHAQGEARGAMSAVQFLLMELGEVEYDEAAETTWDIVTGEGASDEV